jgi:hypothetical protein
VFRLKNFNLEIFYSSCAIPDDFWLIHRLNISMPFIALAFLFLIACFAYKWFQRDDPNLLRNKIKASPFDNAISFYLSGLGSLYTFIINLSTNPFRCFQQIDGSYTLVPASYLDCYDLSWKQNYFSIVTGLAYIALIPVIFGCILWKLKTNSSNNIYIFRFGVLTKEFKKEYWWWGLFQLFKKTLLVMLINLTSNSNPFFRSFLVLLVLLFTLFVETLLQPRIESSTSKFLSFL